MKESRLWSIVIIQWTQEHFVPTLEVGVTTLLALYIFIDMYLFLVCDDDDVRLFGGDTENEGRVEFCSMGRWTLVCHDFWDNNDAQVVCRQLGFNVEGKLTCLTSLMINIITLCIM